MDLDPERAVGLREAGMLLAHDAEIGQRPAVGKEGGILVVQGQRLRLSRRAHRHLTQPPDALSTPAAAPDQLDLVEGVDLVVVLGVLDDRPGPVAREALELVRAFLVHNLDREITLHPTLVSL